MVGRTCHLPQPPTEQQWLYLHRWNNKAQVEVHAELRVASAEEDEALEDSTPNDDLLERQSPLGVITGNSLALC